jgi:hypothetical protein
MISDAFYQPAHARPDQALSTADWATARPDYGTFGNGRAAGRPRRARGQERRAEPLGRRNPIRHGSSLAPVSPAHACGDPLPASPVTSSGMQAGKHATAG